MAIHRPASPTARITRFALLEHQIETELGASVLCPSVMDPGFWTAAGAQSDPGLQQRIDDVVVTADHGRRAEIRFALADLTDDPRKPKFAGNRTTAPRATRDRATEQRFTASLAKITAMYAAFQLRLDLNLLARSNPSIRTARDLFNKAWKSWHDGTQQDEAGPGEPYPHELSIHGRLVKKQGRILALTYGDWNADHKNPWKDGSPNLANIFAVDETKNPLTVDFKRAGDWRASLDFATHFHDSTPDLAAFDVPFFERMLKMIDESDNAAARSCILDVGYLYIASCLWQSGLFRPERDGGLWLGATYVPSLGPKWIPALAGFPTYQCASPAAAVAFMTLLAQGRLVSKKDSDEMLRLLDKKKKLPRRPNEPPGERYFDGSGFLAQSFVGAAVGEYLGRAAANEHPPRQLPEYPYPMDAIYSKIGIGPNDETSDVALVEDHAFGIRLRYVVAFIDAPDARFDLALETMKKIHFCLLQAHAH